MLEGLTKTIRSQSLPRLLGFLASGEAASPAGSVAPQSLRSAPHFNVGYPSTREFILMAQAARRISER